MERTENGAFMIEGVTYIPWRHYSNRLLWQVNALWKDHSESFSLIAEDIVEAINLAHKSYKKYIVEEEVLELMEAQWKLEKDNEKQEV